MAAEPATAPEAPSEAPAATPEEETPEEAQESPVESDLADPPPRRVIQKWNEYDLKLFTFQWGIYTILDWGTAIQDANSKQQVDDITDALKIRDFRFTFKGKFATQRDITYTCGLMFDGPSASWFPRETGIQVAIPELWGNVFVGRQKEGFSLSKVSVGYAIWPMERMPMNDAVVPIMTDGIKWLGGLPNKRANWNLGFFHNFLPKNPSTGWYDDAVVARAAWLPMLPESEGALLHLGLGYHWGQYADREAQLRSRPESFTAPYFLDTGVFPAKENHLFGPELYFRKGQWLFGAEYFFNQVRSEEANDPFFHGGEAFVSWLATGEERPYHDVGGKLGFVFPDRSAFEGGPGAWEPLLHVSYSDFDDGTIQGGTFWRVTPHVNWYLDSLVRLEFAYGFGVLDRFGVRGTTHFFQSRLQLQIQ